MEQSAKEAEAEAEKLRALASHEKVSAKSLQSQLDGARTEGRSLSGDLRKLEQTAAAAQDEAERLRTQLAHDKLSGKSLQSQLDAARAEAKSAAKTLQGQVETARAQAGTLRDELARTLRSLEKHKASAKSNPAVVALKERLKETESEFEEKLAKTRETMRRLRADAGRAQEQLEETTVRTKRLESRLEREQASAKKAKEQLALPKRIDGNLAVLQKKLEETRESGLATRKLAAEANEAVENVEKLIDRLTKTLPAPKGKRR